tara:strand:+ start:57 stop:815 length:759 start_codon:yes stop_codon:yes gene_type:complete
MDKMIHMSLNSLDIALRKQAVSAQNLSNVNVTGFRRDVFENFASLYLRAEDQLDSRAFAVTTGSGQFDEQQGRMRATHQATDLAIDGEGYFASRRSGLQDSLTRRGDMSVSMEGNLVNGQGALILSETLQPIQVPPFREIYVREDGKLLIEPINGEPGVTQLIGSIGLVSGEGQQMRKDDDGEIRPANGAPIVTDQNVNVKQGYLEESNVSVIDELVASMGYQRSYEMNLKLIKLASDLDQGTASLLRMPSN